jgi:hypothetical protein
MSSETRILGRDGVVTVHTDNYGFGSIVTGPPSRPEPPRREDRKLDRAALKKKLKLTDAELEEVFGLEEFPTAARRTSVGSWSITLVWSEAAVDRWIKKKRALAATITRLLG